MNDKPVVIRLKEAEASIFAAVNAAIQEQELPCYLIEPIIEKVYNQVKTTAAREYEIAKAQMEEQAQKKDEKGGDDNGP